MGHFFEVSAIQTSSSVTLTISDDKSEKSILQFLKFSKAVDSVTD